MRSRKRAWGALEDAGEDAGESPLAWTTSSTSSSSSSSSSSFSSPALRPSTALVAPGFAPLSAGSGSPEAAEDGRRMRARVVRVPVATTEQAARGPMDRWVALLEARGDAWHACMVDKFSGVVLHAAVLRGLDAEEVLQELFDASCAVVDEHRRTQPKLPRRPGGVEVRRDVGEPASLLARFAAWCEGADCWTKLASLPRGARDRARVLFDAWNVTSAGPQLGSAPLLRFLDPAAVVRVRVAEDDALRPSAGGGEARDDEGDGEEDEVEDARRERGGAPELSMGSARLAPIPGRSVAEAQTPVVGPPEAPLVPPPMLVSRPDWWVGR